MASEQTQEDKAPAESETTADPGCICRGNWREIVRECEPLIGRRFLSHDGKEYYFFGVVHGDDDYYYGMNSQAGEGLMLLSCVGSLEGHGYTLAPKNETSKARPSAVKDEQPAPPSQREIASRLRKLAEDMGELAVAMDYYGGFSEWAKHGRELAGAGETARQWADEIEKTDV